MAEYEIEVKCKNCGKPISVLAPSRWGYKKRNRNSSWDYFCTWKCLREDEKKHEKKQKAAEEEKKTAAYRDREDEIRRLIRVVKDGKDPYEHLKGEGYANPKDTMRRLRLQAKDEYPELYTEIVALGLKDMRKGNGKKGAVINKMTPENKEKAIEIAIAGGDYIKHLKECGAGNPHASWSYIKQQLAREDPAKYDELMAALEKKKPEVTVAKQLPMDARGSVSKEEMYRALGVPAEAVIEKPITKALVFDGLTVTAVSQDDFKIERGGKNGEKITVFWPDDGSDTIKLLVQMTSMSVEKWQKFMEIMPKAMRVLGVNI